MAVQDRKYSILHPFIKEVFDVVFFEKKTLNKNTIVTGFREYLNTVSLTKYRRSAIKEAGVKTDENIVLCFQLYLKENYMYEVDACTDLTEDQNKIIAFAIKKTGNYKADAICETLTSILEKKYGDNLEFYKVALGFCNTKRMKDLVELYLIDNNCGNIHKTAFCCLF